VFLFLLDHAPLRSRFCPVSKKMTAMFEISATARRDAEMLRKWPSDGDEARKRSVFLYRGSYEMTFGHTNGGMKVEG
jgi:hypothetical protein